MKSASAKRWENFSQQFDYFTLGDKYRADGTRVTTYARLRMSVCGILGLAGLDSVIHGLLVSWSPWVPVTAFARSWMAFNAVRERKVRSG